MSKATDHEALPEHEDALASRSPWGAALVGVAIGLGLGGIGSSLIVEPGDLTFFASLLLGALGGSISVLISLLRE